MGPIIARVLVEGLRASRHRQIDHFDDLTAARVSALSTDAEGVARPFPIQVDGDHEPPGWLEARVLPGALAVLSPTH